MKIDVKRFEYSDKYVISKMFLDGKYQCYVIEKNGTIPKNTYYLRVEYANNFERELPKILDVPGVEEVVIHAGNTKQNPPCSLLLGTVWAGNNYVGDNAKAYTCFFMKLDKALKAGELATIKVGDAVDDFDD